MPSKINFNELATILDKNRSAQISESHWSRVRTAVVNSHQRFVQEEKALTISSVDLHKAFSL